MFRARTPPEAIDLVSRLLEYTPSSRISPLQACAHTFFDELRETNTRLPYGRELPPLFNFTEQGELILQDSNRYNLTTDHEGLIKNEQQFQYVSLHVDIVKLHSISTLLIKHWHE